jgi:hypothetical protein
MAFKMFVFSLSFSCSSILISPMFLLGGLFGYITSASYIRIGAAYLSDNLLACLYEHYLFYTLDLSTPDTVGEI